MGNWKSYFIDLLQERVDVRNEPDIVTEGGKSYTSHMITQCVDPKISALNPKNLLVMATGIIAGSRASSSNRLSIGSKSPLTGGIKESNIGGTPGYALSRLGIRSLVFTGKSSRGWQIILVGAEGVSIIDGNNYAGLGIYPTVEQLRDRFGKNVAILAIGQAGELQLKAALIGGTDVDGVPSRQAGRGGMGAVMGSKGIKAIVIDPTGQNKFEPFDVGMLNEATRRFVKGLQDNPSTGQSLPKYGTAGLVKTINALGGLPTRNYSSGNFENVDMISGDALYNLIIERNGKPTHPCMPGCVIRCSNVLPGKNGMELTRGFEYETLALLGSNCGIGDLDKIGELNFICDDIGLDSMETGVAMGVAMEGGELKFGEADKAIEILREIPTKDGIGRIIGNGAVNTGKAFRVNRIPAVRGQAMSAYDPRVFKGIGVTYATSPMGADHTAGNALPGSKLPDGRQPNHSLPDDQVELSAYLQKLAVVFDTLGLCWFTRNPILADNRLLTDLLTALNGGAWSLEALLEKGKQTILEEETFNKRAGVNPENDVPAFFRLEPIGPNHLVFDVDVSDLQKIRDL